MISLSDMQQVRASLSGLPTGQAGVSLLSHSVLVFQVDHVPKYIPQNIKSPRVTE